MEKIEKRKEFCLCTFMAHFSLKEGIALFPAKRILSILTAAPFLTDRVRVTWLFSTLTSLFTSESA
ncbi:MAG: hypothetical protein BWY86_00335 [Candidatus Aminicenantes bacterium ADurb.Bin508]|nr:MAG: hypothetical protein BWY86_00335 [Candidatus Aminicenantes bacterium ADurb.Bin508]